MKTKTNSGKARCMISSLFSPTIKSVIIIILILTGIQLPVRAQLYKDKNHSWWFGVATGANMNFYSSSIQELNSTLTSPVAFNNGSGIGLYFAPLAEFHLPGSTWSIMLEAGYDSRKGAFDEKDAPCGCTDDLSTGLSYITVEPSLRFAPFKSDFYLYAGPRLAFNLNKSFLYKQGVNSDFLNQVAHLKRNGDFSNMNKTIFSMQIGAGYDIPVSSQRKPTQFVLSPFVSFQPYFGQSPRSIETWNVTTLRVGVALKHSREHKISTPKKVTNVSMF
ncbi:MAG: porin family protein [Bacteroidota bacterium]